MLRRMELQYANAGDALTLRHKFVGDIASELSPRWKKFLSTKPRCELKWYNKMVDWLVKYYPDTFKIGT